LDYNSSLNLKHNKLIYIFGPTGAGKTDLAVRVADGIGEIISVDSMQVYRGLDCATAKPTEEQLRKVNHYLVNIVDPYYRFSAGDFKRLALKAISDIYKKKKVPFLVGGTGLYFRALEYGLIDAPKANLKIRESLYAEEEKSKGILYERLMDLDAETAKRLHPNDLIRIVRALEIYIITGSRFSEIINKNKYKSFDILKIGVNIERSELYSRLEKRCEKMIDNGLAEEVHNLLKKGYTEKYPSMKGLGYSQFIKYYKGCLSFNETIRLFKRDTKRYAKRQLTWFRREDGTYWFQPYDFKLIKEKIKSFIA